MLGSWYEIAFGIIAAWRAPLDALPLIFGDQAGEHLAEVRVLGA